MKTKRKNKSLVKIIKDNLEQAYSQLTPEKQQEIKSQPKEMDNYAKKKLNDNIDRL